MFNFITGPLISSVCSVFCVFFRSEGTMVTYGGMAKQPVTVPVVSVTL